MTTVSEKERDILEKVLNALREPLPKNGSPHVIVIVYNSKEWHVNKAAPKGAGGYG